MNCSGLPGICTLFYLFISSFQTILPLHMIIRLNVMFCGCILMHYVLPKDGVEGTEKPVFGVNVITVMETGTGICDRACLSMESIILKCVWVWLSASAKKHLCVNICTFCKSALFFSVSRPVCFGVQSFSKQITGKLKDFKLCKGLCYVTQSGAHSEGKFSC